MLGVDGIGDRRCWAILARNLSVEYRERQAERKKERKRTYKEKEHTRKKEEEHKRKKRDGIRTAELNRRDQVTATGPGPVSFERGNEVDYQVAAPTESSIPTMHRATIAQQRVRMEGWRQERLGSRAGTHREEEKNKNILTGRKREKTEKRT
jgi:hypothetical protein